MAFGVGVSDKVVDTFGSTTATTPGVATQATGSTFLIGIMTGASRTISTVTDNKGNGSFSAIGTAQTYNGAAQKCIWYKKENGAGGAAHTFSVTIDSSDFLSVFALEITGATTGGEDTAVAAKANDVSSPFTVTSGSLAQASEVLAVLIGFNSVNVSGLAESSGFTIQQSILTGASDASGAIATLVTSATGTYTPSFTGTGGLNDCGLQIVGFKNPVTTPQNQLAWIKA